MIFKKHLLFIVVGIVSLNCLLAKDAAEISSQASTAYSVLNGYYNSSTPLDSDEIIGLAAIRDELFADNSVSAYLLALGLNAGIQDVLIAEQLRTPSYYPDTEPRNQRLDEIVQLYQQTKMDERQEVQRMYDYDSDYSAYLQENNIGLNSILEGKANQNYSQTYSPYVDEITRTGALYYSIPTENLTDYTFIKLLVGLQRQRDVGKVMEFNADHGFMPRNIAEFRKLFAEYHDNSFGTRLDTGTASTATFSAAPGTKQIEYAIGRLGEGANILMYLYPFIDNPNIFSNAHQRALRTLSENPSYLFLLQNDARFYEPQVAPSVLKETTPSAKSDTALSENLNLNEDPQVSPDQREHIETLPADQKKKPVSIWIWIGLFALIVILVGYYFTQGAKRRSK